MLTKGGEENDGFEEEVMGGIKLIFYWSS